MAAERLVLDARRAPQRGMSMIEMLVTIVLISIGLIGLLGLLAQARQFSTDAEDRGRAASLAGDLAAQMMLSHNVNLSAGYITAWKASVIANLQGGLPTLVSAQTAVQVNADSDCTIDGAGNCTAAENVATITIVWQSPHKSTVSTYTTTVVVP